MAWRAATLVLAFAIVIAAPLLFHRAPDTGEGEAPETSARRVIILTPHHEQIRDEFGRAFARWHLEVHGEAAEVIWTIPGGTNDIRRMLQAQFEKALRDGRAPGGAADLVFGGGQYEHDKLKQGVTVVNGGQTLHATISVPVPFTQAWLEERYGENRIGDNPVYDHDGYWFGTALASFGIVFNRDVIRDLGARVPVTWEDLCQPALAGAVALGNPAQSGSVQKIFDTVLQRHGWADGWRMLRRAAANARSFAASSGAVPIDVAHGSAAAGISIDYYGRYEAQALADAGHSDRFGYIDPIGATTIDADPISMLRGAPNEETARRFIVFCLSDQGQALWQFRRGALVNDLHGPSVSELRRLPIRRVMYRRYLTHFVDQVDPYTLAKPFDDFRADYLPFVALLFNAMAIDNQEDLRRAWREIVNHPAYPQQEGIVGAEDVADPALRAMLDRFDAFPRLFGPRGAVYDLADPETLATVHEGWLQGAWRGEGLWAEEARPDEALRALCATFFRENYRAIAP